MNYEYGKEYPCSGHKPGLEGDVVVEVKTKRFNFGELSAAKVSSIKWGSVLGFRIVDERYKSKKDGNTWFERGELPPVGVECEYLGCNNRWDRCKIVFITDYVVVIEGLAHLNEPVQVSFNVGHWPDFRPLKTAREKAIEAAIAVDLSITSSQAGALYDAGLLRLPEEK